MGVRRRDRKQKKKQRKILWMRNTPSRLTRHGDVSMTMTRATKRRMGTAEEK
jgi:hypothetical protein